MENLKEYSTVDIVEELKNREGIETKIAEPYETLNTKVEGPAIVLVVVD